MYALLCRLISDNLSTDENSLSVDTIVRAESNEKDDEQAITGQKGNYREMLLLYCKTEFEVKRSEIIANIRQSITLTTEEKEFQEILMKRKHTGHIRFVGELFKQNMLKPRIIFACISDLLHPTEQSDNAAEKTPETTVNVSEEEDLVCLCKLFQTVGQKFEEYCLKSRKRYENLNAIFYEIDELSNKHALSRVRFMLRVSYCCIICMIL